METLGKYLRDTTPAKISKPVAASRPYPGFLQAIGLIVLLAVVELLVECIDGTINSRGLPGFPLLELNTLISFSVIFAYGLRKAKAPFSEVFPLTRVRWVLYFPMALCLVGMHTISLNVISFLYAVYPPPVFVKHYLLDLVHVRWGYWNLFFELVVIAPVTEEFFCRGLILHGFLKRYSVVTAVVATAVFFGAVHGNLWQFSYATLDGLLFGWWAVETGSLLPCLFGHALDNSFAFVEFVCFRRWAGIRPAKMLQTVRYASPWFVLAGACVFGVGIFILAQSFQARPPVATSNPVAGAEFTLP